MNSIEYGLAAAAIFSAGCAAGSLIFNYLLIHESSKTRQLQLFENIFLEIKNTERLLYDKYKKLDSNAKKEWDSLFFNTLEFFAFLINKKYLEDKKIIGFFDDAIVDWYERIFMEYHKDELDDPETYPELKRLYKCIKERRKKIDKKVDKIKRLKSMRKELAKDNLSSDEILKEISDVKDESVS